MLNCGSWSHMGLQSECEDHETFDNSKKVLNIQQPKMNQKPMCNESKMILVGPAHCITLF